MEIKTTGGIIKSSKLLACVPNFGLPIGKDRMISRLNTYLLFIFTSMSKESDVAY
ncbi:MULTISPECIES: hypothetical protein [Vibrio]|uniref:hypothetical protein n=1 Tax=Vibrio TaxID=662 RepID=UPI0014957017|nr:MULTISPECIES: hypothetical protein [Vibrio]USD58482.1 hypothetical protein J4N44_27705 [Vibrio sp. SCSIO 43155]